MYSGTALVFFFIQSVLGHSLGPSIFGGSSALQAFGIDSRSPSRHFSRGHDHASHENEDFHAGALLNSRAEKMTCGSVNGTCPAGYCCSIGGFCGKGFHYCSGPACQLSYGDSCDGNIAPNGTNTKDIPRPHIGNVSYEGKGIYTCTNKNHVALTFDDGPYIYTSDLLDILDEYNAKATFFITGNNMGKGEIDNETTGYPQIIQRMHRDGHQIASHTWTHQNLSAATPEHRANQMYYNEMAIRNVLGFIPTYMRPPYSQADNDTQKMLYDMGYHITYYNIISNDYNNNDAVLIENSKNAIDKQFDTVNATAGYPANFIEIAHDIHEQTVYNLTRWTLERMKTLGFGTSITVGECLNDPPENWYRKADGAPPDAAVFRTLNVSITPTAIPKSGPSGTSTSRSAAATAMPAGSGLGLLGLGVLAAGMVL